MAGKSRFSDVPLAPPDGIFNVLAQFKEDEHPQKVNLSVGGEMSWRSIVFLIVASRQSSSFTV